MKPWVSMLSVYSNLFFINRGIFSCALFNAALSDAPQTLLCRRMLGSNPPDCCDFGIGSQTL